MKVRKIYFYKFLSIFIIAGISFVLYLNFSPDQTYSPRDSKKRGNIIESNGVASNFSLNQAKFLSHSKHKESGDDQETSLTNNSYSNTMASGSTQPYSSDSYNEDLANSQYQDYQHNYENSVVSSTSNNNSNHNEEVAMPAISSPGLIPPNKVREKDQQKQVTTNKNLQGARPFPNEEPMDLPYCDCGNPVNETCTPNPDCDPPEETPLDGHEYLLIFAGIVLGIKKLKKGFK